MCGGLANVVTEDKLAALPPCSETKNETGAGTAEAPVEEASFLELAKVAGFACKELLRQTRDGGFVAWDRSASGERTLVAYEFKLSKGKPAGKQRPAFQRQPSSGTQRRPSKS